MSRALMGGAASRPLRAAAAARWIAIRGVLACTMAAALPLAAAQAAGQAAVPQVFLVQNSGWMEPFFSDPSSQYKALVTEVMLAAAGQGDAVVLASFNQSQPGAPSPKALLSERADATQLRAHVAAALSPLAVAKKPGSGALADTDLGEAVSAAIGTALENKPGLVWLFTNNKNSPNNDQATAARNREFYELIHHGGAIRKALAFPLHMPVKGKTYSANGLMVYVFAIHDAGAAQLDALLRSGRLRRVITETPARLKPLDQDTVRLRPVRVENVPGVAFSTLPNGMLRADVDAAATAAMKGGGAPAARIGWQLENAIYPYTIASAHLDAASALAGEQKAITLGSDSVRQLAPGKPQPLSSTMQLPVAQLPGKWSLAAVKAAGSAQLLPGRVEVRLSEQTLELSQAFRQRMAALFPGDPLPDIFTPPAQIQGSRAVLPLEVRVNYGTAPLLAALGLVGALLALAAGLAIAMTRGRKVRLVVEGEPRAIHTRPGMRTPIHDKAGNKVAELHTTLFASTLNDLREGAQVRLEK